MWMAKRSTPNRVPQIAGGFAVVVAIVVVILATTGAFTSAHAGSGYNNPEEAVACNADAKTVETAVAAYDAYPPSNCTSATCVIGKETDGTAPGDIVPGDPSTYGTSTNAQLLVTNDDLNAWIGTNPYYSISLSTTFAGQVIVYVPATSQVGTIYDDQAATTGCNSL
jgi:uncharacterized protein YpmB